MTAAVAAAADIASDLPVVAYRLEHNTGSRRTAERAGLHLLWRGPDVGNPDPAAERLVIGGPPGVIRVLTATTDEP